jgi:prevent-host-death family protein
MREIGVRELKSKLSEVLRAVEDGEEVRVTVHGRPVAEIRPTAESEEDRLMRQLIAEGRVTPPSRPVPRNIPIPPPGKGSATAIILAEREEDR